MSIRSSRTEEARAARARRASRSAPSAASDSPATESGSKSARAKAPPADDWAFVERVLASPVADAVYVWGPPGTGKTFAACHADRGGRELFNVTLTPETPAAELRGFFVPRGVEFVWQDGVFVEAMRKGARLVINEVAHASADVLAILHPLLESRETARLTLPNLETVVPAPGFQVVCTDNLPPDHLPPALRDRFKSLLHVDRPHPAALERLRPGLREAALRTFDLEPERAVSVRGWLAVQGFEAELGAEGSLRAVFGVDRGAQLFEALSLGAA